MSTSNDKRQRLERLRRLRKLGLKRGARGLARPHEPRAAVEVSPLPGEVVETPFGSAWVRTARYSLTERPDLAEWLDTTPVTLAALGRDPRLEALAPASAAFIDTETTGLSIGTGTYTFLIGIGTYELGEETGFLEHRSGRATSEETRFLDNISGAFVVRQFFMRSPAEERAQLHLVEEALNNCTGVVSFNGRAFDLPLLQNRFILARRPLPLAGAPHLDLLPPARRLWRARIGSCTLGNLEQSVLGMERAEDDVPGWMIPDIYRDYYRTGVATEMMARVFYHNLVDITSLPVLAARMARFFRWPDCAEQLGSLHPLECTSLARCYEGLGWQDAGEAAYRSALAAPLDDTDRTKAMRNLSFLLKRQGRRAEAAALWEEWISSVPGDDLTPYIELAKHHEWHTKDLATARGWTAWALQIAEGWTSDYARDVTLAELRHRLARLERKLARDREDGR